MLRVLSLCTGIGGCDLAAEWAGMQIVGQVEIDKFCQKVLEHHWPQVKRLENIYDVRGDEFGPVDLITAGWPCTPHSLAGKRKGASDHRNLWPEIIRILACARPPFFVGENVPGLLSSDNGHFFSSVIADLATLGYSVGWCTYGAVDVGAWHRRDRVFIIAHANSQRQQQRSGCISDIWGRTSNGGQEIIAHTPGTGLPDWAGGEMGQPSPLTEFERPDGKVVADSKGKGALRRERSQTDVDSQMRQGNGDKDIQQWEALGSLRGMASGVSRRLDGRRIPVRNRVNRLRALGNAVCPEQIYPVYKAIVESENEMP